MSPQETEWAAAVEQHRPYLFAIAYRMLGSRSDAEDVLQEAWLRARQTTDAVQNSRAYLSTIVVRLCIDDAKSARSRRETYVGPWLPEPILDSALPNDNDGSPDRALALRESVSIAFLVMLETLSPLERAAFVLREVFDYEFDEIGVVLGRSTTACRQLFHRAKTHVDSGKHRFEPDEGDVQRLVSTFLAALSQGDAAMLASLLADDATSTSDGGGYAKAALKVVAGQDRVARFVLGLRQKAAPGLSYEVRLINGEWGLILRNSQGVCFNAMIFHCYQGKVQAIYSILNPKKLRSLAAP